MQRSKTSANTPIDVIRILTFCKLSQTIRENEEGKDRRVIEAEEERLLFLAARKGGVVCGCSSKSPS